MELSNVDVSYEVHIITIRSWLSNGSHILPSMRAMLDEKVHASASDRTVKLPDSLDDFDK